MLIINTCLYTRPTHTSQEAYQPRLMFGEALMSAVNMGQMLHAAENADDADKLKTKVGMCGCEWVVWMGDFRRGCSVGRHMRQASGEADVQSHATFKRPEVVILTVRWSCRWCWCCAFPPHCTLLCTGARICGAAAAAHS